MSNDIYSKSKSPARITGLRRAKKGPSQSHDKLFKSLFEEKDSVIVSSTPKVFSAIHPEDFTDNFYISDEELEAYAQGFLDVCTEENIDDILLDQEVEDESLDNIALDDSDIKLSLYRSFKSIYDKWIANSKIGDSNGYFFNQYGQQDNRTLFQHFNFVNRGAADIGGKAVIDIATLSDLTNTSGGKGPTESLYQLTSRILSKNNFDFFALPTYIQYSNFDTQSLADMFKAFPDKINEVTPSPTFLCVYIGGNSRALDIPRSGCDKDNKISFQYKNDSFDISDPTQYPTDISDSQSLTAFKVRYGQEAQNHFTKIELDQQEFKETQESLMVIDALANPKKGGSPTQSGKGNNIYDMYLTRSYSCKVSALGNFQIQPLMYFQLDNVPMFKGTYMITNVTHKITPQKVETEFKGTRQPLVQTPIVVDPISLLDLALSEGTVEGERGSLGTFQGSGAITPLDLGGLSEFNDSTVTGYVNLEEGKSYVEKLTTTQKNNIKIIVDKLKLIGITQPFAIAAVLSIVSKESNFTPTSERFIYSAARLVEVFPSRFPTQQSVLDGGFVNPDTLKSDTEFYQKKLANRLYGNRYGNSESPKSNIGPLSDDGWNFRGNGFNQLTFKGSYKSQAENSGVDIFNNPYLLNQPEPAAKVVSAFMAKRIKSLQSSGKISAYGATGANDFPDITNAVLAYYHCNTGTGKSVAEVKAKLTGALGGMKRAQERAPFLLEYIQTSGLV